MLHGERNKNSRLEKLVIEIMRLGYSFVMTFLLLFFFIRIIYIFFEYDIFGYSFVMTFLLLFFIRIIYISFLKLLF